ncbi:MAG: ATP-binding protein [Eubacteriales bacterium]
MKQLLVLSGKGGTGKTTVAAAFIKLARAKAYADCDIDAPNLHLALPQKNKPMTEDFYGMDKAEIDETICTSCGRCKTYCRYGAILVKDGKYSVNPFACEGCAVCDLVCKFDAVRMRPAKAGELKLYQAPDVFSTGELTMGSGNSGKLVTEVKNKLKNNATEKLAIIDGSPGIGCPVIASLVGVDMVLIVTEPSLSGLSDLMRIVETARRANTKIAVTVNKFDLSPEVTERIKDYCQVENLPMVELIPYDEKAGEAANTGKTVVDIDSQAGRRVTQAFDQVMQLL